MFWRAIGMALAALFATAPVVASNGPAPGALRLGYMPNLTHAQALVGVAEGSFQQALGKTRLVPISFPSGPLIVEALFAGEIDLAYIGPNPAINGYVRSQGEAFRVIAGACSGGASLVLRKDIAFRKPADLRGKRLGTPGLANTQDVALRTYLQTHGLAPSAMGGDVLVLPLSNADIYALMARGQIDGAWVPEPWATRLVVELGARRALDERELWPGGLFPTTVVVARTAFLKKHPEVVRRFLAVHVALTEQLSRGEKLDVANRQLEVLLGKPLPRGILEESVSRLRFTDQPLPTAFETLARRARQLGFLRSTPQLSGLIDTGLLREVQANEAGGR